MIPSVWGEAFGIVALEGMASGCIEICSDSDGLQEAIGNNGFLFKRVMSLTSQFVWKKYSSFQMKNE